MECLQNTGLSEKTAVTGVDVEVARHSGNHGKAEIIGGVATDGLEFPSCKTGNQRGLPPFSTALGATVGAIQRL